MTNTKKNKILNIVIGTTVTVMVLSGPFVLARTSSLSDAKNMTTDQKIERLINLSPNSFSFISSDIKNTMTEEELNLYEIRKETDRIRKQVEGVYIPTEKYNRINVRRDGRVAFRANGFFVNDITVIVDGDNIHFCVVEEIQTGRERTVINRRIYENFYVDIFSDQIVTTIANLEQCDRRFPLSNVFNDDMLMSVENGALQQQEMLDATRNHISSLPENANRLRLINNS